MAGEERVLMSTKELRRRHVMQQVVEGKRTQVHAAQVVGLTDRQMRRLVTRVRLEGAQGLVHCSRGQPSNRAIKPRTKARILKRYEARYHDVGPTLAVEKLAERDGRSAPADSAWGRSVGRALSQDLTGVPQRLYCRAQRAPVPTTARVPLPGHFYFGRNRTLLLWLDTVSQNH